jgi:hypothetical protein
MTPRLLSFAAAACLATGSAAFGQAVVLEVFKSDVGDMADFQPTGAALEYQARPLGSWGKLSYGLGARVSADDGESLWLGGGLYAEAPVSESWLAEATLMPGYYDPGSTDFDLGSDLEFQSSLGVGYRLNPVTRLSFALTHLSNGGTAERNPGRNALALRLRHSF